jgi:Asp-tRNA(Asn)/Glu-tRNA(Gln) amidotransferase A subunit family amidase
MALSWTQDRPGPMCRYAEDCALVMAAIAKPDDRDLSVQDIPFNWNANLDITKVRVGYQKKAFDAQTNPVSKANDQKTLDQLTTLGVKLIPIDIPDFPIAVESHSVEMAVFFDEFIRSGRGPLATNQSRSDGFRASRLVPAVEYLQSQRARTMMMMQLAKATEGVDVFLIPRPGNNAGGGDEAAGARGARGGGGNEAAGARGARGGGGGGGGNQVQTPQNQLNYACYPALAVPNGFTEAGMPTSMTFFARPFGESELLAVARAYQDASKHHLKHPTIKLTSA